MESNLTAVKVELDIAAQRIIHQVIMNNEQVSKEIEAGVRAAVENFDFKTAVEKQVIRCIEGAIQQSGDWGAIKEAARKATDDIVSEFIKKSVAKWKEEMGL